jgi:hypothetical protein
MTDHNMATSKKFTFEETQAKYNLSAQEDIINKLMNKYKTYTGGLPRDGNKPQSWSRKAFVRICSGPPPLVFCNASPQVALSRLSVYLAAPLAWLRV